MPDELRERVAMALTAYLWGKEVTNLTRQLMGGAADAAIAAYEATRPTEPDPATIERMTRAYVRAQAPNCTEAYIDAVLAPGNSITEGMLAAWHAEQDEPAT